MRLMGVIKPVLTGDAAEALYGRLLLARSAEDSQGLLSYALGKGPVVGRFSRLMWR